MIFWNPIPVSRTADCFYMRIGMYHGTEKIISYRVVIIGGGASGMTAAIAALEEKAGRARKKTTDKDCGDVLLLESNDRVGKKILATGNGKCNFTHENIGEESYDTDDREVLKAVLEFFPTKRAVCFFEELGMLSRNKNGYFYPLTETASTVLDVLRLRLSELGCKTACNVRIEQVKKEKDGGYLIEYSGRETARIHAESVIIATGSKAGGFLQDKRESPLRPAQMLGLHITPLYPALTKCICREDFYKAMAGVRVQARLMLYEETCPEKVSSRQDNGDASGEMGKARRLLRQEEGELQLTKEGISGIVVFQMSGEIARMLSEKKRMTVEINFLPDFPEEKLEEWVSERLRRFSGRAPEDFFLGVMHKKLLMVCLRREKIKPSGILREEMAIAVMRRAMHFTTEVTGAADMKQAQVCRGGIRLSEFDKKLECKKLPGIFACGEVLNVDGICGGYNLHFAWASGYLAGREAMRRAMRP